MSEIHHLEDGKIVLYRRAGSSRWQARFRRAKESGWDRFATGEDDLDAAKRVALRKFHEIEFLAERGIAVGSRHSFAKVAEEVIKELEAKGLRAVRGSVIAKSYIFAIRGYLIPFFGTMRIDAIEPQHFDDFSAWRRKKLGFEPKKTTVNTHNLALRRIFKHAYKKKWRGDVPELENDGVEGERGSWFEAHEVEAILDDLAEHAHKGRKQVSKGLNYLLWNYVAIILATGMRPGTEARNLRWKDVEEFEKDGVIHLRLHVKGKTGERSLIARQFAWIHFDNLAPKDERDPEAKVFALPDGTEPKDLHGAFERCLVRTSLLIDRRGRRRSLYSLRHTYATTSILGGVDLHTLARQMGTSIAMLERHYSHLTPTMRAKELSIDPTAVGVGLGPAP